MATVKALLHKSEMNKPQAEGLSGLITEELLWLKLLENSMLAMSERCQNSVPHSLLYIGLCSP